MEKQQQMFPKKVFHGDLKKKVFNSQCKTKRKFLQGLFHKIQFKEKSAILVVTASYS